MVFCSDWWCGMRRKRSTFNTTRSMLRRRQYRGCVVGVYMMGLSALVIAMIVAKRTDVPRTGLAIVVDIGMVAFGCLLGGVTGALSGLARKARTGAIIGLSVSGGLTCGFWLVLGLHVAVTMPFRAMCTVMIASALGALVGAASAMAAGNYELTSETVVENHKDREGEPGKDAKNA